VGSSSLLPRIPSSRIELRDSHCVNEVNLVEGERKESDLVTRMSRNSKPEVISGD
jgi:hypothetical protein